MGLRAGERRHFIIISRARAENEVRRRKCGTCWRKTVSSDAAAGFSPLSFFHCSFRCAFISLISLIAPVSLAPDTCRVILRDVKMSFSRISLASRKRGGRRDPSRRPWSSIRDFWEEEKDVSLLCVSHDMEINVAPTRGKAFVRLLDVINL